MFCRKCGSIVPEEAVVCDVCGEPVNGVAAVAPPPVPVTEPVPESKPANTKRVLIIAAVIVAAAVLAAAALLLLLSSTKGKDTPEDAAMMYVEAGMEFDGAKLCRIMPQFAKNDLIALEDGDTPDSAVKRYYKAYKDLYPDFVWSDVKVEIEKDVDLDRDEIKEIERHFKTEDIDGITVFQCKVTGLDYYGREQEEKDVYVMCCEIDGRWYACEAMAPVWEYMHNDDDDEYLY